VDHNYLFVVVGYAELMAPGKLYYAELSDLSTGHQHVLKFSRASANGDMMLEFRDAHGRLLATLAPFIEWPELDADELCADALALEFLDLEMSRGDAGAFPRC
jgi:hypothetical protein